MHEMSRERKTNDKRFDKVREEKAPKVEATMKIRSLKRYVNI